MAVSYVQHCKARVKPLLACLAALILVCCMAMTITPKAALASGSTTYVLDEYGLFSPDERNELESAGRQASEQLDCNVYFLTVSDIGSKSARNYAIDYYNDHGLGAGSSRSGILFLVAIDSRDYVTVTYGDATAIFTDYQIDVIESNVVKHLSDGKWLKAAKTYFEDCNNTIEYYAKNGSAIDNVHGSSGSMSIAEMVLLPLAAALVIALIVAGAMTKAGVSAMKTAKEQSMANDYAKESGISLSVSDDQFVTTTTVVVPLPEHDGKKPGGGSTIDFKGFGGSRGGKF